MLKPRMVLWLCALLAVISMVVYYADPEMFSRYAQAERDSGFKGEMRETALLVLALGLGGFIAYLAITRR